MALTEQERTYMKGEKRANPNMTREELVTELSAFRKEIGAAEPSVPAIGDGQAKVAPLEAKTVAVQPQIPAAPVQVDLAEIQRTGKLPEGVTPEQANQAIQEQRVTEGAPVLKQEEKTVIDEIGIRLKEAGEEFSPQDKFIAKNVIPLVVGGGTGLLAKGALKAAPWFAELAASSPKLASIIAGAVEGAGFEAGMKGAEGELPTAKGVAGSAALFGGIPAAGAVLGAGKELLGKAIPESLVKSAIKLKPTQKIKVAENLAKMGEEVGADTAEQYLLKNRISGSPEEVAAKLKETAKTARQTKLDSLKPLTNKFKDAKIGQFADEVVKATDGVAGVEEVASKARELQKAVKSKQGATLAQIDELKTLFDQNLNVYTFAGNQREGVTKTGLANLRGYTKTFIEKEAEKLGVSNIKQLNQDVILNNVLSRSIAGQSVGAGGNALLKLAEGVVGGGLGGSAIYAASGGDWSQAMKLTLGGLGVVAGAKFFNPEMRIKLANALSKKLSAGEAGAFLKVLEGDRGGLDEKLAEKIRGAFKELGAKVEPIKNTKGFIDPGEIKKSFSNKNAPKSFDEMFADVDFGTTSLLGEAKKYKTFAEFEKDASSVIGKSNMQVIQEQGKGKTKLLNALVKENIKTKSQLKEIYNKAKSFSKASPAKSATTKGEYLYHGTNKNAFDQIKTEGIKPQRRGVSSLSKSEEYSKNWANNPWTKQNGVMLRVKKDFLKGKTIRNNTKVQTDKLNEILTKETIPPESLEIFKDGKWQPLTSKVENAKIGGMDTKLATEAKKYKSADEFINLVKEGKSTDPFAPESDLIIPAKYTDLARGKGLKSVELPIEKIKVRQEDFKRVITGKDNVKTSSKRIIIDENNRIIDGHHRYNILKNKGKTQIPVFKFVKNAEYDINDLIKLARGEKVEPLSGGIKTNLSSQLKDIWKQANK